LSDHLSSETLGALADGELSGDRLALVNQHLAGCAECTSRALAQALLKSATARAGNRYTPPPDLRERMVQLASQETSRLRTIPAGPTMRTSPGFRSFGWAAAVALLLVCVSLLMIGRNSPRPSADFAGLVTEACDQHIAALTASSPPEVISSDRHTVKPWFQGKIPFSFNLPQNLPADTVLDGANLTYLHNQPTAQLLYSIGKHRVSVFVQQRNGATTEKNLSADHSGFHVTGFRTNDLEVVAVSDVDPARLSDLVSRIEQVQTDSQGQPK
jgi:anti-sigma factor RsiW